MRNSAGKGLPCEGIWPRFVKKTPDQIIHPPTFPCPQFVFGRRIQKTG